MIAVAGPPADERLFAHAPDVDSLRAIAMMAVLAMHAKLLPFGWAGVWLFFVISGYVVTLSILKRGGDPDQTARLSNFYERRVGRIVPVYYAYLLAGLLLSLWIGRAPDTGVIFSLFGFYQNIAMGLGGGEMQTWPTGHLWSISIEMQFYLVYGIAAHRLSIATTRRMLWIFVLAAPLLRACVSAFATGGDPQATAFAIYSGPTLHFDSFAMGCLLALARLQAPIERLAPPLIRLGFGAMILYLGSYAAVNFLLRDRSGVEIVRDIISGILLGEGREIFLYTALGLFSLAILAMTLASHPAIHWLVRNRALQWIGGISYGAYVYHALILETTARLATGQWNAIESASPLYRIGIMLAALGLTLVVASLSYRYFERPTAKIIGSQLRSNGLSKEPILR